MNGNRQQKTKSLVKRKFTASFCLYSSKKPNTTRKPKLVPFWVLVLYIILPFPCERLCIVLLLLSQRRYLSRVLHYRLLLLLLLLKHSSALLVANIIVYLLLLLQTHFDLRRSQPQAVIPRPETAFIFFVWYFSSLPKKILDPIPVSPTYP